MSPFTHDFDRMYTKPSESFLEWVPAHCEGCDWEGELETGALREDWSGNCPRCGRSVKIYTANYGGYDWSLV